MISEKTTTEIFATYIAIAGEGEYGNFLLGYRQAEQSLLPEIERLEGLIGLKTMSEQDARDIITHQKEIISGLEAEVKSVLRFSDKQEQSRIDLEAEVKRLEDEWQKLAVALQMALSK